MRLLVALAAVAALVACSGGGSSPGPGAPGPGATSTPAVTPTPGVTPTPTPAPTSSGPPAPPLDAHLMLAAGFAGNTIANVSNARELAALPNGDVLVGTRSATVFIVPNAEAPGAAGAPAPFITLPEGATNGIVFAPNGFVYVGTEYHVWRIPYRAGDRSEPSSSAVSLALVRQGPISPGSDGDVHTTTSLAATATTLYAGVGSSCNACVEVDPTRASIQRMNLDGTAMTTLAHRMRNPIALAVNPATGTLWAGGAGQDGLPYHHPYEYVDPVTLHAAPVDYGWPACEENHVAYIAGSDCSNTVAPRVEFPAYATLIGATFYPTSPSGAYAFAAAYRGALFVANHGSWHCCPSTIPRVSFVPMSGDVPLTPVNWSDPTQQWQTLLVDSRSSSANTSYPTRFTGIAVGASGSLFVADDQTGSIYRIRPR